MRKKYSYVGIAFIILLFGIYTVPKVVNRFQDSGLVKFDKVPNFEFINQEGQTITNKSYEGKVYVVEFFFSTCPTICPLMNKKMLTLQDAFFGNPEFGIASISITPEIDSPKILKDYAQDNGINHKNWHLLTGKSEDVVYALSNKGFKLYAGKGDESHAGFEHSGLFALVDKDGYIRSRKDEFGNPIMYYRALQEQTFPDQIKELKEDIKLLLNE
ncbi:SCO family protein [Polaribacter reichenbachii]|uniref:Photosynthetic protein synthase II n=1 Tax=Polaribacter reichenbachii TaxID=996801 RepID=A0A1B8U7F0_9FLAO|nr:SCO family protein [Polaribacter reichenbachii]APZ46430.1 SCO family protein [Polaribacter reichenbachii]AUC20295.1 SCO family protein [Polaribacter reichenbachii]OBY67804.1 photosynthetic protein synthase II [Polaribacter reichenbachii]